MIGLQALAATKQEYPASRPTGALGHVTFPATCQAAPGPIDVSSSPNGPLPPPYDWTSTEGRPSTVGACSLVPCPPQGCETGAKPMSSESSWGQQEKGCSKAAGRKTASKQSSKDEQRKERARATNRRAQIKYRFKIKNRASEITGAYESAVAELGGLRLEHAALRLENVLLEKVLSFREHSLGLLQEGREIVRPLRVPGVESLAALWAAESFPGDDPRCPVGESLSHSEVAQLRQVPAEVVAACFRATVMRMRDALVALRKAEGWPEGQAASPDGVAAAEEELRAVLYDTRVLCFKQAILKPEGFHRLLVASTDVGVGGQARVDSMQRWAAVARVLGFTLEQRQALVRPLEVFQEALGRVMAERRGIFQRLRALTVTQGRLVLNDVTAQWVATNAVNAELKINLAVEHEACICFLVATCGAVFSNRQKAAAFVAAWPVFPDVFALVTSVCDGLPALELTSIAE